MRGILLRGTAIASLLTPISVASATGVDVERARLVIQRNTEARAHLQSGVFWANGTKTRRHVTGSGVILHEGELTLFGAFEDVTRRRRFDRRETAWMELDPARPVIGEGRYARTDEYSALLNVRPGTFSRVNLHPADFDAPATVRPIDVRNLGSLNHGELESTRNYPYDFSWVYGNDTEGYLTIARLIEVESESPTLHRLSWGIGPQAEVKRTIWFDEQQGCSPIRLEERYPMAVGTPPRITPPFVWDEEPSTISEVTWHELDGVWVPSTFSIKIQAGHLEPPYEITYEKGYALAFTWQRVNEAIPDELFAPEELAKDQQPAMVVDFRQGTPPVILEHPRIKDPKTIRLLNERAKERKAANPPVPQSRSRGGWLLIMNASLFAALIGAAAVRKLRRRASLIRSAAEGAPARRPDLL